MRQHKKGGLKNLQIFSPGKRTAALPVGSVASSSQAAGRPGQQLGLQDLPARVEVSTSVGRAGLPARQQVVQSLREAAEGPRESQGSQLQERPDRYAPEQSVFVCAATQEGRVGVATPMKKSGAAEKSSPFPGEQDFLRERGGPNTSRMKRPAASQTQTTAGRRGLKRPAAAAGKGEALASQGLGSEGDRRSESAGAQVMDMGRQPSKSVSKHSKPGKRMFAESEKIKPSKPAGTKLAKHASDYKNYSFCAKGYGQCKVEFYTAKSYIRQWRAKEKRYSMIIGDSTPQHRAVCRALVKQVQAGMSRDKLMELRATLQNRFL